MAAMAVPNESRTGNKKSGTPATMADIVCAPQMVLTMFSAFIESHGKVRLVRPAMPM
jgi:hypothetical protein